MFLLIIVFLVDPESISVVEGTTVEFTCTANNTNAILYFVDNITASLNTVTQRGFTEQDTESLDNGVLRRNLTVITSTENNNNNSVIYCQAIGSANTNSDTATLTIQGTVLS